MSAAERARFIEASAGAFHPVFYRLLMDTGLRSGEAYVLKWAYLDCKGERIAAHPKTSKSRRTLPMFGLRDELLAHKTWQAEHGLDSSGHVFTMQEGVPLAPWTFSRRELGRTLKAPGIEGNFTPQQLQAHLRHTSPAVGNASQGGE